MMTVMLRGLAAAGILFALSASSPAREQLTDIKWGQLVPPLPPQADLRSKSLLAGARRPEQQGSEPPPPTPDDPEAPWLSQKRLQPGTGGVTPVVQELDGKRVRIGGYVVPLDFKATAVTEFLLVPYVGACIHVPPPPPNQIIYVKSAEGFKMNGLFDPVYVTGTIKTATVSSVLAETGYSIEADTVDVRPER